MDYAIFKKLTFLQQSAVETYQ